MRYVLRPEPLRVGEQPYGLGQFLMYYVDNAVRFVSGQRGIRAGMRIAEAIRAFESKDDGEPAGYLAMEEEDWQALRDELETPKLMKIGGEIEQPAFPLTPARNLLRFIDALAEAKTEKPKCYPAACATENAKPNGGRKRAGKAPEPSPDAGT